MARYGMTNAWTIAHRQKIKHNVQSLTRSSASTDWTLVATPSLILHLNTCPSVYSLVSTSLPVPIYIATIHLSG